MFGLRHQLLDGIEALKTQIAELKVEKRVLGREAELSGEVVKLKTEISDLKIDKSRIAEEHAKDERELKHMIGLEKKRQEFEIESAKREAALAVREENLAAEKAEFQRQLEFNTARFEKMETYLKDILGDILKRLPDVNVELRRDAGRR